MNVEEIEKSVESNIRKLSNVFKHKHNDFFFTEKELHSYFYHLCIDDPLYFEENNFNIIHTEYPTPFRCHKIPNSPYIQIAKLESNKQRAHIDCVIINPNYINWVMEHPQKENLYKTIIGLGGSNRFDQYVIEYYQAYDDFIESHNKEPIILYSIEFKFLRHTYVGSKYSIIGIEQDVEKLRLLSEFYCEPLRKPLKFSKHNYSLVFIGERNNKIENKIINHFSNNNNVKFITKQ